jgi:hypothetical protein
MVNLFPSSPAVRFSFQVLIVEGGMVCWHHYLCSSHLEALHMAIADHSNPLPVGARYAVQGPCTETSCNCGASFAQSPTLI